MNTEIYRVFKAINIDSLCKDDMDELLRFFLVTRNDLIRNHIAFIFADLQYEKAVPYILKKINEKGLAQTNGSLVFSLTSFDMSKYFIQLVQIICNHEYEPRLMAYDIIQKHISSMSLLDRNKSIMMLEERRRELEEMGEEMGENGALHFVEKTIELLS